MASSKRIVCKMPRYSGLSSINYQLDECKLYEATTVGTEMFFSAIIHALEAPRHQDQDLDTTSLLYCVTAVYVQYSISR